MPLDPASSARLRVQGLSAAPQPPAALAGEQPAFDCGDLFYDDGSAEDALFFGGGQAGSPDHFMGIRFELADFGLAPGHFELTGLCISNQIDFSAQGGPWPNEVFVFRDLDGVPDLDHPQRQATVITGDGGGRFEVEFESAWRLDEPVFWLLVRGDPLHEGEDFNVETDQSSKPSGRSWLADRGIPFMVQTEQNLMLRATIRPTGRAGARAVPSLQAPAVGVLILLFWLGAISIWTRA